jgi:iron-sulfur cluster assembly protein
MSCCSSHRKHEEQPKQQHSCCSSKQSNHEHRCCRSKTPKSIGAEMTIDEILKLFPYQSERLSEEISKAGLSCVGCHAAVWETLSDGMKTHGKSDEQIEELVTKLNLLLKEPVDLEKISITTHGAEKFLGILLEENKEGWGMRFSEEPSCCHDEFEYVLDFSEKPEEDDQIFESNGVQIHVKKTKLQRLLGSEIDFVNDAFKISNPNDKPRCGCRSH